MFSSLVLFDVDDTLVKRGLHTAHGLAFECVFKKIYGIDSSIVKLPFAGMTDYAIILEVMKVNGFTEKQVIEKIDYFNDEMLLAFKKFFPKNPVQLLPGVKELLQVLTQKNCLLGLATGNLEGIAREKMNSYGINDFFRMGGFGDKIKNRVDVVKNALKQAKEQFGFDNLEKTFVVGDTLADIQAGKDARIKTIGVLTGSTKNLRKYNPDFLFESLENTNEILKVLDLK